MNDTAISTRQKKILLALQTQPSGLSRAQLAKLLTEKGIKVSKATLLRDLSKLEKLGKVFLTGSGRTTKYQVKTHPLLFYLDVKTYFANDVGKRKGKTTFDFAVFEKLTHLFTPDELSYLDNLNQTYLIKIKSISPDLYKKELERFVIELSWKSSKIEGNTYTLLETEQLIKELRQAPGKTQAEAQMILNHKEAFEVILKHTESFKKLTLADILNIHAVLVKGLGVTKNIRQHKVGITGTDYVPLDNQWQIKEALNKLIRVVNQLPHPVEKAFVALAMLSYVQPFNDGNKRTARLVSNALLMAHNYAPLSYRNVDELEFKKAMLLFYEQNNLRYLKEIFIEQFKYVVENYFGNL